MDTTNQYGNLKISLSYALDHAEDLKSKLTQTDNILSEGVVIAGKGFNHDKLVEYMNKVDKVKNNLNTLIQYCNNKISELESLNNEVVDNSSTSDNLSESSSEETTISDNKGSDSGLTKPPVKKNQSSDVSFTNRFN